MGRMVRPPARRAHPARAAPGRRCARPARAARAALVVTAEPTVAAADGPGRRTGTVGAMETLLVELGASTGAARSVADELVARHLEPHRSYHTLDHVTEVLAEVDRLLPLEPEADAVAVRVAAWFHDAIYDPTAGPGESEAASADLAFDRIPALALADRDHLVDEVVRLVLATAHHGPATDPSSAVLVDADLWILSAPPERYDRYAAAVRTEYAHVADDAWVAGRGSLLTRFLVGASDLYAAGPDHDRAERRGRATANLQRELASLRPGGAGTPSSSP